MLLDIMICLLRGNQSSASLKYIRCTTEKTTPASRSKTSNGQEVKSLKIKGN